MYSFKYATVSFPLAYSFPKYIYSLEIIQNRYEHTMAKVVFKDWGLDFDSVTTRSPMTIELTDLTSKTIVFNGYVEYVNPSLTPGSNSTEVGFIGASGNMRNEVEAVYRNTTADQVVKQIANKYGFSCYSVPTTRVYPQVSQSARSDWQLMVRLAKQNGYTLRSHNTELYFQPVLEDYTKYRAQAKRFVLRTPESVEGTTIYSFEPLIGESIDYKESVKAAVAVAGLDQNTKSIVKTAKQDQSKKTRRKKKNETFDKFAADIVVNDPETARLEAEAAESRNAFPYRAWVTVLGDPSLRPDMPVFLDGLGRTYSGYWTVLSTEHYVVEKEPQQYTYTTTMYVGTDSLGIAETWTDNKNITQPDYIPKRTIIPNVRQTNYVPTSSLIVTSPINKQGAEDASSLVTNKPPAEDVLARTAFWRNNNPVSDVDFADPKKPPSVLARLKRVGVL